MYNFTNKSAKSNFKKWGDWEVGDWLMGKFTKTAKDQYGNETYVINVLDGEWDSGKIPAAGEPFTFNSAGQLAKRYEEGDVVEGELLKIKLMEPIPITEGKYKGGHYTNLEISTAPDSSDSSEPSGVDAL